MQVLINSGKGDFELSPSTLPDSKCDFKTKQGNMVTVACWTTAIALADTDNDGDLDVIIGNRFGSNYLVKNQGVGHFDEAVVLTPGNAGYNGTGPTAAVAVGDVDGDGQVDVVFAEEGAASLFLRSDGKGGFERAVALPGQSCSNPPNCISTEAVLLGDIDGDGHPDVVVGNDGDPNVFWRNDGHGWFAPPVNLPGSPKASTRALAFARI